MEFFDSSICEISAFTKPFPKIICPYNEDNLWNDVGYSQVVLLRDTAFELDGVGFNLVTSSDIEDGVTVIGDELNDISENRSFARACIVQIDKSCEEQEYYKLIKKIDYVKYHCFPEGYMMRTASRSHKESVRVAKSALKKSISFEKIGNLLINRYKQIPEVKSVKVIFITAKEVDYKKTEAMAQKSVSITEALNHTMNSVKFDCDTCNFKPVCDEIEGMKELHFKNSLIGV